MSGLNKIFLIGNLGRDPEMRYLPSGSPVTNFSIAVSRRWNDREGQQREETDWFDVDCFEKLAETANQYLQKGKQVFIEGRVQLDTWDDRQTGEKRSKLKVRAANMTLLGSRGDQGDSERPSSSGNSEELDNMPF